MKLNNFCRIQEFNYPTKYEADLINELQNTYNKIHEIVEDHKVAEYADSMEVLISDVESLRELQRLTRMIMVLKKLLSLIKGSSDASLDSILGMKHIPNIFLIS